MVKRYIVLAVLLGLTGVGLYIRVHGLSAYYYSPDEAIELWMSGQDTISEAWQLGLREPHPPLRYIILHCMQAVSHDRLFLRMFALAPGLGLIWIFFALGRRVSGTAAGLAMAGMATFGFGAVLVSDVARVYPLAACFQSAALYYWVSYLDEGQSRRLWAFSVCAILMMGTVYIQAIVIAAIYGGWLIFLIARKKPARDFRNLFLTALPLGATVIFLYFLHLRHIFSTARFANPVKPWIAPFFFHDLSGFAANIHDLFGYLFLPPIAALTLVLALSGLAALCRQSRWVVTIVILLTLGLNIVLTLAGKFSLGGIRHSFHFFPFFALAIGASIQYAYDLAEKQLAARLAGATLRRLSIAAPAMAMVIFIAATFLVTRYYSRSDYLRRYSSKSWTELPLLTHDYQMGMYELLGHLRPGDVIFASYQTIIYLELETNPKWTAVSEDLSKINYRGYDWYFLTFEGAAGGWGIPPSETLRSLLQSLVKITAAPPTGRVWIVNLGWEGQINYMTTDAFWVSRLQVKAEAPGVGLYLVPASSLWPEPPMLGAP